MRQSGFPSIRLLAQRNRGSLAGALRSAGFDWPFGFHPLAAVPGVDDVPLEDGSVIIADDSRMADTVRQLGARDPRRLSLVLLSHGRDDEPFEYYAATRRDQLRSQYRQVAVLHAESRDADIARAVAGVVRNARFAPGSTLLWIIDDEAVRFESGGCWHRLIEQATSPGFARPVTILQSLVTPAMLDGHEARTQLVAGFRDLVLTPAITHDLPLVVVTDNHFSRDDTSLGEAWGEAVRQYVPCSAVFVATGRGSALERYRGLRPVWLDDRGRLADHFADGVLTETQGLHAVPAVEQVPLADARVARALALSSERFRPVWADLLRLPDSTIAEGLNAVVREEDIPDADAHLMRAAIERAGIRIADAVATLEAPTPVMQHPDARTVVAERWRRLLEAPRGQSAPPRGGRDGPLSFLAVIDEWSSKAGGLSTLNRELCLALADQGHRVYCLVSQATNDDVASAEKGRVELVRAQELPGDPHGLALALPFRPPLAPDFILGHGRVTGPAARAQAIHHLHGANRVHFFHMAPEEIEPIKALDRNQPEPLSRSHERMKSEVELCRGAILAVGVGPRLTRALDTALIGHAVDTPVHRLDPGLVPSDLARVRFPAAMRCLILGRVDEYGLKGVGLAARAVNAVALAGRDYSNRVELLVRGAQLDGSATALRQRLLQDAPNLVAILRGFTTDPDDLLADFRQSSVVLMPSRVEGFGLAAFEAIAHGVPVLVGATSGLGELLNEHGLGSDVVVSTAGTNEEVVVRWIEALHRVLSDREAAFRRAEDLRQRLAQICRWDVAVARLIQALDAARSGLK